MPNTHELPQAESADPIVDTECRSIGERVLKLMGWIDRQVDTASEHIADSFIAAFKAGFYRLFHTKAHMEKHSSLPQKTWAMAA